MIKSIKYFVSFVIFLTALLWAPMVVGQTKPPKPPSEKEQYKAIEKRERAGKKADDKAKKQYQKRQSKESKKNMKRTKKKSDRNRKSKKPPFWEGWFIKK